MQRGSCKTLRSGTIQANRCRKRRFQVMRIAVAIGGLLLLVLAFGSWAYGNRETRLMWDQRYQSAFSAYGRTVQYVDSENEDYGRQYPDFQRALDDLEASATPYY